MRRLGDVARHQHSLAAGLLDPARGLLGILMLVEVGDQQVGAFACEGYAAAAGLCLRSRDGAVAENVDPHTA